MAGTRKTYAGHGVGRPLRSSKCPSPAHEAGMRRNGTASTLHFERTKETVDLRRITDWTQLTGASIEIRQQGSPICSGHVDAVTDDGTILWLRPIGQNRRLFEKAESYEAWAAEDRAGFHYEVTKRLSHGS